MKSLIIDNILHIFPTTGKLYNLIKNLAALKATQHSIEYDIKSLNAEIKDQANAFLIAWNSINNQKASSVRFIADEDYVLVSNKKSYSIDKEFITKNKLYNKYDFFVTTKRYILNEKYKNILFDMLTSGFGKNCISYFFDEHLDIQIDADKIEAFMSNENISDDDKLLIKKVARKHEPSIKCNR